MDLYLYEARDKDLLEFYRTMQPSIARMILIAMVEQSRRRGGFSIGSVQVAASEKGAPVVIRLRVDQKQYPDVCKLWESYPRKTRSGFFVTRLRDVLMEMNRGALLSDGGVSLIPTVEHITIEAPKIASEDEASVDTAIGTESMLGADTLVDDLLGSLDGI